ncbi:response regulator [Gracilibacillus caseinilyticus]|uniref:Response regulator n=1 Tax=Gracilibacillus caseinilyticus TaxID=2932256 RepID=A0ABY4EZN8_9BACI|nr:response regulator [Gracilibacillus caseinilyticus]UOQ49867.1 response regulator [Gracilibacillus caseinilyticus]
MYRVVLVDDDALVIEFLRRMIPWEQYGFEVMASFKDSQQALAYLENNSFDVLITDIGMPRLNGIELISQLRKQNIASYNIILSCHDEFRFAQQALKLEAYDYILKESMEEEHLIAVLEQLKDTIDQDRLSVSKQHKLAKFLEDNNAILKAKFLEKIMQEDRLQHTDWLEEQEQLLGIDFYHEAFTVVLTYIDQYYDAIAHYENDTILQFAVNNIVEEVLGENHQQHVQVFYLKGRFLMLFPNKAEDIYYTMEKIHAHMKHFLNISVTSVVSGADLQHQQLIEHMRLLLNNKDARFYYPHNSIQAFYLESYCQETLFTNYVAFIKRLKDYILTEEQEPLMHLLSNEFSVIKKKKYAPAMVKDWVMKAILDMNISLNALRNFEADSLETITAYVMYKIETIEHLEKVTKVIFTQFIDQVKEMDVSQKNEDIIKVQKYVQTHLDKKLSLTAAAEHLHLNASYFSRMFKRETGEGFIEYVTKLKMEKALELVDHTTKSTEEIAYALGFDTKSYFLKLFKKHHGYSPKDYRYREEVKSRL